MFCDGGRCGRWAEEERPVGKEMSSSNRSKRPLRFRTQFRNTVYDAMLKRGWRETEGDEWDIHWAERDWINEHFDTMHLNAWQKVNHFRNDRELCRKDLLVKNLNKQKLKN